MADEERQEDPVLAALNTAITEIRAIRAELGTLAERVTWLIGDSDEDTAPPADTGSSDA